MQNIEFDKRVKEIIDGHLEVSSEDSWERLELALNSRKSARLLYFRRSIYASVAVAASLLLFVVLGRDGSEPALLENKSQMAENISKPANNNGAITVVPNESKATERLVGNTYKNVSAQIVKQKVDQKVGQEVEQEVEQEGGQKAVQILEQKSTQISDQKAEQKSVQTSGQKSVQASEQTAEQKSVQTSEQKSEQKPKQTVPQNKGNASIKSFINDLYAGFEDEPVNKKGFTKGLLYAFSTNLSPSLYNKSISMLSVSLGYQNDFVPMNLKETIPQQSMSDRRYAMPMAFGFQAQLPLNNKLSMGLGISYSLLVSQYQNIEYNNRQDVQQSLHYIGVPVNAYYKLMHSKQLSLYLAAGMAVEKAIVASYRIVENGAKRTENYPISGVQFSMNGGIGVEVMLNKELGLYFDPSIAYYFKSNQPENIRTVQQLQYKLELGMRFHL